MEFQYRACDERNRPSPTPPAPVTASSGSAAAARVRDGHGGDGTGYHREISSAAAPSATAPPSLASDPDERRRREAKERIRERILREQAEALQALALETEVRRELMDMVLRSGLARLAPAEGAEARAAPALAPSADSPSPVVLEMHSVQPQPKANGSASLPAKRKSPDVAAAASAESSRVSAPTSSKKQKPSGLTCTVCDIRLTGEKPMQEHLKGKSHTRKATMLAPPVAEHDENEKKDVIRSKANESAAALPAKRETSDVVAAAAFTVPAAVSSKKKKKQDLTCTMCGITLTSEKSLQDHLRGRSHKRKASALALPPTALEPVLEKEEEKEYRPEKLTMITNAGEIYSVMQMNGFLLCKVCDVKTADLVTMMCHLEGSKHTSMVKQKQLPGAENQPPLVPVATGTKKRVKGLRAAPPSSTDVAGAGDDAEEVKKVDVPAATTTTGGREAVLADQAKSNEASIAIAGTGHTTQGNDSKKVKEQATGDVAVAAPPAMPQVDDVACPGTSVAPIKLDKHAEVIATTLAEKEKVEVDDSMKVKEQAAGPGASVAPIKLDKHAEIGDATIVAEEEKVVADDSLKVKELAAGDVAVALPPATPQVDDSACAGSSMAPMKLDKHVEVGDATAVAEEEKTSADVNGPVTSQVKEDVFAPPIRGVKIQIEGKMCTTVVRQADGTLSCWLCGVHGCDKNGILQHLYTRAHCVRVRLAEEKGDGAGLATTADNLGTGNC